MAEHSENEKKDMRLPKEEYRTMADVFRLPEGERAELIDGRLYLMSSPSELHQDILVKLLVEIELYFRKNKGSCKVFPAPYDVFLNADRHVLVQPDLSVICDPGKRRRGGCYGPPDWVIEILSPATRNRDTGLKLFQYRDSGVREYWIADPENKTVRVYDFQNGSNCREYRFSDSIPVGIYDGFAICLENTVD